MQGGILRGSTVRMWIPTSGNIPVIFNSLTPHQGIEMTGIFECFRFLQRGL